jgi:hypothetical protein
MNDVINARAYAMMTPYLLGSGHQSLLACMQAAEQQTKGFGIGMALVT